jgi:predicted Zn-dependent protease
MARARAILSVWLAVCLVAGTSVRARAQTESDMGRIFFLQARSQLPLVEDPAVQEYVQALGNKLAGNLGAQQFDYRFYVVRHPSLNAFAVPGGYIFMFSGLIARAETDDEIVGVLGHEIAHVHNHHIIRQQTQGQVWNVASLLGMFLGVVNPVLAAGAIAAAQTAQLKFSREFEQEADFLGLKLTTGAGYDPHALSAFFKQLLVEQRLNPTGVPPYMLSHPVTEDRITNAESVIKAQNLTAPRGRPAADPALREVRAVTSAMGEPPAVVTGRYKRAADAAPNDAEAQFLLGRVYQTVGQLDSARASLERARELGGLDGRVDRPLGSVYLGLKNPEKASESLRRHLDRKPKDAFSHAELGQALALGGADEAALVEYQKALRLDPDLHTAHQLTGLALGRKGEQGQGLYHLAMASELRGELDQAMRFFYRARPLLPAGSPERRKAEASIEELRELVSPETRRETRS